MKSSAVFAVTILLCLGLSCLVEGIGIPIKFRKRQASPGDLTTFGKDIMWTAKIGVGSNKQPLEMLIDTGSSDTWMNSELCTNEDCWRNFRGRQRFKNSESSTFREISKRGDPLAIVYGNGVSVAYEVGSDSVDVSGTEISDQQIGSASNILNRAMEADGILGLGPEKFIAEPGTELGVRTVYRNLAEQGKIPKASFSIKLVKAEEGGGGELRFGEPDTSAVSGEIVYTPTTSDDFWQVATDTISVGAKDLGRSPDVVFDTGASLIFGPCGVVSSIYNEIPGSELRKDGNWTIPCDTSSSVSFHISNRPWLVPASDMVRTDEPDPDDDSRCVGAIQQYDDEDFVILGVPFIKNYLVAFDADSLQVGLGDRVDVPLR